MLQVIHKGSFPAKVQCEYIISSETVTPDELTVRLGIIPHRYFHKGATYKSKHSGSLITRPHNLWAVASQTSYSTTQAIKPHLAELKSLLDIRVQELIQLKQDPDVDTTFWIWVESDGSGIEVDFNEKELDFIYNISNSTSFSLIARKDAT